jgi:hypothetical protein
MTRLLNYTTTVHYFPSGLNLEVHFLKLSYGQSLLVDTIYICSCLTALSYNNIQVPNKKQQHSENIFYFSQLPMFLCHWHWDCQFTPPQNVTPHQSNQDRKKTVKEIMWRLHEPDQMRFRNWIAFLIFLFLYTLSL